MRRNIRKPRIFKGYKKDWNDMIVWHLRSLTYHPTFDILKNAGEIKDYLPYYEHNQLTKQVKFIVDYYEATVQIRTENLNIHKKKIFRILLNVHVNCFIKF